MSIEKRGPHVCPRFYNADLAIPRYLLSDATNVKKEQIGQHQVDEKSERNKVVG